MKLAAREMGSIQALKASLKRGGSNGETWIKGIPSDGITVRFLTEPEMWFGFYEYFDRDNKQFIPMVEGEILPDGVKPSFRYLTVAVDMESDRVIPLKLPKTAANSLILKYDKYGTLGDRCYELEKFGEGLDTTYDVSPQAPTEFAAEKYELLDLEAILVAARSKALGEAVEEEPFPESDIDDDVTTAAAPADDSDIDDEESEADEADEVDLFEMTIRELRVAAITHNIDPRGKTRAQLIDELVDALED